MIIKNNLMFLVVLVSLTAFMSCGDELELYPEDAIATELGYKTVTDFEAATKGVYSGFRRSGYYGATSGAGSIYFIPDVMSDDVIINSAGRRSREAFYDWRYDEDNSTETFWLSAYKVIQRANVIISKIDNLENAVEKDNFLGEALAARGIAHFDLAKLYASSPAQGSASDLGIPYVTSTDASLRPSRNTLGETYDLIIDDLTRAKDLINTDNGEGRFNKNLVSAALSRIYLFMGDYSKSLAAANEITGVSPLTRDDFLNFWKDASTTSSIWRVPVREADGVSIGVAWLQESPDGIRSEYNVDYALFQLYQDNDIRKSVYFETGPFAGVDYNHMVKYRGRLSGNANEVDAKPYRYAEILLNKAEALANTDRDPEALVELDILRANRYSDFVSGNETGQALKDAIALERRLELAFEGVRFFDLKRKGLAIERSEFGDNAVGEGFPAEFMTLPANDYKFNMAIGSGETDANPNIQQNPGY